MQTRLDKYCSSLCESRTKAQDLIKKGNVKVNGVVIKKASTLLEPEDRVEIVQDDPYVSRAAYKLLGAVESYAINLKEKTVLDVGASTGGFTDVCLQHGAKKVYALDVGHLQLAKRLDQDSRVIKMEGRPW